MSTQVTDPIATQQKQTTMQQAAQLGQAIWLDYIRRSFIENGGLAKLVAQGLRGVTSNPSIFEKAIAESDDYAKVLDNPANAKLSTAQIYDQIVIADIQAAADVLRPVYDRTGGKDGFVSLEVEPSMASSTDKTTAEAKRLWDLVKRPNVMIKIPGTPEGVQAIEDSIAAGINVNVTLLFAVAAYEDAAKAYIRGLQRYAKSHNDLSRIASVASFFLSRIDTAVDKQLDEKAKSANGTDKDRLLGLRGKAAIANAKIAYERFQKIFSGPQWEPLAKKGAQKQRVLWASTGTKNPAYPDTYYVDTLIGADTVNTVPPATLDAFLDHGKVAQTVTTDVGGAHKLMSDLAAAGISIDDVTHKLLADGVKLFEDAFKQLIDAIKEHQPK